MKSASSHAVGVFHSAAISHAAGVFHPSARTDFTEKIILITIQIMNSHAGNAFRSVFRTATQEFGILREHIFFKSKMYFCFRYRIKNSIGSEIFLLVKSRFRAVK